MDMVRLELTDGTKKEITIDEFRIISFDGLNEALEGKAVINLEFFENL